jgi:alanine dehydrogenase
MMVKVKEPLECEYPLFRDGLILYTYLHLAADKQQTDALPWISVYDPSGESAQRYNVQSLPEFFLIDRSNALYKRSSQMDNLEAEIKTLLANPTASAR